jgi:hypothetical protein
MKTSFNKKTKGELEEEQSPLPGDKILAEWWSFVLQTKITTNSDVIVAKQVLGDITRYLAALRSRKQVAKGLQNQLEAKISEFEKNGICL